ncbi:hypothetical protein HK099_008363 [Clydaea vesicula]|uniref:Uncharacterized protein n=1 Tax=Clydaea vesicula TaxID=447962 RepID=A0AAD5XXM7_9FUNG|nr:hypothetical protein HK099_008363 [Clydaea vesicula]
MEEITEFEADLEKERLLKVARKKSSEIDLPESTAISDQPASIADSVDDLEFENRVQNPTKVDTTNKKPPRTLVQGFFTAFNSIINESENLPNTLKERILMTTGGDLPPPKKTPESGFPGQNDSQCENSMLSQTYSSNDYPLSEQINNDSSNVFTNIEQSDNYLPESTVEEHNDFVEQYHVPTISGFSDNNNIVPNFSSNSTNITSKSRLSKFGPSVLNVDSNIYALNTNYERPSSPPRNINANPKNFPNSELANSSLISPPSDFGDCGSVSKRGQTPPLSNSLFSNPEKPSSLDFFNSATLNEGMQNVIFDNDKKTSYWESESRGRSPTQRMPINDTKTSKSPSPKKTGASNNLEARDTYLGNYNYPETGNLNAASRSQSPKINSISVSNTYDALTQEKKVNNISHLISHRSKSNSPETSNSPGSFNFPQENNSIKKDDVNISDQSDLAENKLNNNSEAFPTTTKAANDLLDFNESSDDTVQMNGKDNIFQNVSSTLSNSVETSYTATTLNAMEFKKYTPVATNYPFKTSPAINLNPTETSNIGNKNAGNDQIKTAASLFGSFSSSPQNFSHQLNANVNNFFQPTIPKNQNINAVSTEVKTVTNSQPKKSTASLEICTSETSFKPKPASPPLTLPLKTPLSPDRSNVSSISKLEIDTVHNSKTSYQSSPKTPLSPLKSRNSPTSPSRQLNSESSQVASLQSKIQVLETMLEQTQNNLKSLKKERDDLKFSLENEYEEKLKMLDLRESDVATGELNVKDSLQLYKKIESSANGIEKILEIKRGELEEEYRIKYERLEERESLFFKKSSIFEEELKKVEIEKNNFQNNKLKFHKEFEEFIIEKDNFFKLKEGNESDGYKKLRFFEEEESRLKDYESKINNFYEEVNLKDFKLKKTLEEVDKKQVVLEKERTEIEKLRLESVALKKAVELESKEFQNRLTLLEEQENLFKKNQSKFEKDCKSKEDSFEKKNANLMEEITMLEEVREKTLNDRNLVENEKKELHSRESALKKLSSELEENKELLNKEKAELQKNSLKLEEDFKNFKLHYDNFLKERDSFQDERNRILELQKSLLDEAKVYKDLKASFEKDKAILLEKESASQRISQQLIDDKSSEAAKLSSFQKKLDQEKRLIEFQRISLNEKEEKQKEMLKNIEAKELEVKEEQHKMVKVHENLQITSENLNKKESHLKNLMQEYESKNSKLNKILNDNSKLKIELEKEKLSLNTRENQLKDEKLKIENEKNSILNSLKQTQKLVGEKFQTLEEEKERINLVKENLEQDKKKLKFEQDELQLSKLELENQSCKLNEQFTWIEKEKGAINELRMKLDQDRIDFERSKLESGGKIAKKKAEKVTGEADSVSSILEEINAESIFKSSANTKPASSPSSSINKGDALVNRNYETELNYFKERIMNLESSNRIFQEKIVTLNDKLASQKAEENITKNITPTSEEEKIKKLLEDFNNDEAAKDESTETDKLLKVILALTSKNQTLNKKVEHLQAYENPRQLSSHNSYSSLPYSPVESSAQSNWKFESEQRHRRVYQNNLKIKAAQEEYDSSQRYDRPLSRLSLSERRLEDSRKSLSNSNTDYKLMSPKVRENFGNIAQPTSLSQRRIDLEKRNSKVLSGFDYRTMNRNQESSSSLYSQNQNSSNYNQQQPEMERRNSFTSQHSIRSEYNPRNNYTGSRYSTSGNTKKRLSRGESIVSTGNSENLKNFFDQNDVDAFSETTKKILFGDEN